MDSEQPVEDETVQEVPSDGETGPWSDAMDATVEPGTDSTSAFVPSKQEEPSMATSVATPEPKSGFHLFNSAPLPEQEEPSDSLLSQEALAHAKLNPKPQVPDKSTSLTSVDPDIQSTEQLSSLSEREFEGLINSPTGQNVIAERSPGGRYVRFMEKLGSGASKDVYRAYDTTEGIEVAWNVVNLAGVPKAERNRIVNEVRLLERLHHHNIISFHGSWVNREKQEVNFITEILSSGTLKSFIDKVQVIRWKIAKRWARQILNGLAYLHEQDPTVIHRDLKCDNIFINGTSGDLRIGDFGLSTVHSNGKALSVLGTPEFMAPDLYEEESYDEKVDIYAFGMVLLEIFTKDIPYRECANPAQIYKKVIRGEPPESLARVRSKEARDFITLCLGYQDEETGKYVRPSAAELLQHSFLGTGVDDDSEVEVDPPLRECMIREEGAESESPRSTPKGVTTKMQIPAPPPRPRPAAAELLPDVKVASQNVHSPAPSNRSSLPSRRDGVPPRPRDVYQARQNSLDDDSDHFEGMPDSEVNIGKNVKVMMGRGQELGSSEDVPPVQPSVPPASNVGNQAPPTTAGARPDVSTGGDVEQAPPPQPVQQHYLVSAVVIEEESPLSRPYDDNILKLIIRLPVEGETQNVQFDFHLIKDDPVQVAKEMVEELEIPQEAVLEISETISGYACNARMKQEKHSSQVKWQQEQHMMPQNMQNQGMQQPGMLMPQQQQRQPSHEDQQMARGMIQDQQMMPQSAQNQGMQQFGMMMPQQQQQRQPFQEDQQMAGMVQEQQMMPQSVQKGMQQPGMMMPQMEQRQPFHEDQQMARGMVQEQQMMPQSVQSQGMQQPGMMMPQPQQRQPSHDDQQIRGIVQPQPQHANQNMAQGNEGYPMNQQPLSYPQPTNQGQLCERQHVPPPPQIHGRSLSGGQVQQPMYAQTPAGGAPQDGNTSQLMHLQQQMVQLAQPPVHQAQAQQPMSHDVPYPGAGHLQYVSAPSLVQQPQPFFHMPAQPEAPNTFVQPQAQPSQPAENAVPRAKVPPRDSQSNPPTTVHLNGGHDSVTKPLSTIESGSSISDIDGMETNGEDGDDESALKEEIRRLDEDFQKNMLRAQKVFDSRMDNLQRSKEEREAQHLKTLEKHEKERAEFEKRLRQAEKEQNRRIEQLQQEWNKRRASLAKHKGGNNTPEADVPPVDGKTTEPTESNAESLGSSMLLSLRRDDLVAAPTHKKSASMNNSESSERSRSSSLNGDFGNNSELT